MAAVDNIIFFNRTESHDDAHLLNEIICDNAHKLDSAFLRRWHECYVEYCKDRVAITFASIEDPDFREFAGLGN